ncbi:MAG: NADH-quinone oxidoreductase subunit NuoG [Deltaproteobacteria bacterium]|nr:NADH-quinone oxidoreductase subunit NuoG [Deltaproteobacteria bacterium]
MPTIFIDNKPYEVKEGQNVLHAAVSHGLNLPYFCWHPALGSVGSCRQCAVQCFKDENDTQGRMVMSCMTPATEGSRFSIEHPNAKSFRADVIEWMMINHPHDCPVCDEGGECHLQDMTVMTGHNKRRYRFKKRTFKNQNLGPNIHHEMNRCITCYRCVRFYRDVAGGEDLHAFSSADNAYFGRFEDGALESEFSGNLVEVCPTGVFTDKIFRASYTRKWDLQTAPSICQQCSLGCNMSPGERLGKIRRIQNRFNPDINGYFLCDKGRFGHQWVNNTPLPTKPISEITWPLNDDKSQVIGIASPKASLEANYALRKLVGAENFYDAQPKGDYLLAERVLEILEQYPETASVEDVRQADLVLVLGEDLTKTAPMLALAIRQNLYRHWQEKADKSKIPAWDDLAVRNAEHELPDVLYMVHNAPTKLDGLVSQRMSLDFEQISDWIPRIRAAKNPVIIAGTSLKSRPLIDLSKELRALAPQAKLCYVLPEVNSMGLALLKPKSLSDLKSPGVEAISLEPSLKSDVMAKVGDFALIDAFESELSKRAAIAFGCASFAESTGTVINNEGRAQRYYSVFERENKRPESWRILRDLGGFSWQNIDELCGDMGREFPVFEPFFAKAHHADFRVHGERISRQTLVASGRTAVNTHLSMHEPTPRVDQDSPLAYSMEGYHGDMPPDLASSYWRPGWNSVQALNALSHAPSGVKLLRRRSV